MGYFSELASTGWAEDYDKSYCDHKMQLLWRYEDLQDRLEELQEKRAAYSGGIRYTEADLRYSPVESFKTISDVLAAMELAADTLAERYNIHLRQQVEEEPIVDELTENQLSFQLILHPCTLPMAV